MWNNPLTYCLIAGLGFGAWPFLGRLSNLPATWVGVVMSLGTLTVVGTWTIIAPHSSGVTPRSVVICFIGGLVNGLGMVAYAKLISWPLPGVEISRVTPLTSVVMGLFVLAIGAIAFQEPITIKKALGVLMAIGAVVLLH
jgi:uncharacterized membrane protein